MDKQKNERVMNKEKVVKIKLDCGQKMEARYYYLFGIQVWRVVVGRF